MTAGEWSLAAVHDVLVDAIGDRPMLICGQVRRTHREVYERSRGLAAFLLSRGITVHRERVELERWEKGQDAVALVLHNCCEYIESMYGAYRARAVPFNVNQHYRAAEIGSLLSDLDTRAIVYHRRYGPLLAEAYDVSSTVLVHVEDGSDVAPLAGSTPYESAVATTVGELPVTSPDDLNLVCTGGTTGRPKAVMWRQGDIYLSGMAGWEGATAEAIATAASAYGAGPWFAAPPLMHAAAQWTAFCGLHSGASVVMYDDSRPFDPSLVWRIIERERVMLMSIVGDAYARPLVEDLQHSTYDLSSFFVLGTGGAATSEHLKDALLDRIPHLTIRDGYGASETGGMAFGERSRTRRVDGFAPAAGATVISADRSRVLEPGDDEIGWIARIGRVPLGYLGDRERTETTFPIVDGQRLSVPGDRGQRVADGSIHMLGRDSMVINTGGEKVFAEEVEAVIRSHADVADALVIGRPSERFGTEVVALVAPQPGAALTPAGVRQFVAGEIARFKAPRAVLLCDSVRRLANGKGDYRWAAEAALSAVDATT